MVIQARIVAHLVAIAEKEGSPPTRMAPDEINQHLKDIAAFAKKQKDYQYEFWITDGYGHSYLRNVDVDFSFKSDQPQAGIFLQLLNGRPDHTDVIVQESRRREIDPLTFKYVGVSGVDKSRIVQVGYETDSLLGQLARKSLTLATAIAALLMLTGALTYLALRRLLSAPLNQLVQAAESMEAGNYETGSLANLRARTDELGRLAAVFENMAGKSSSSDSSQMR